MCDTVVLVEPGRVLFAKNSDRDPNEAQLLDWQPAASHPAGAELRCSYLTIPQAARTHAVLLSRPFWMWGAEMGANEHGVVIGNEAVFTRQPYATTGLTGMDLVRLALERASTAAEAVTVIVDLLREHGQGGGCGLEDPSFTYHNSFLVADHRHAIVLETAGRHHAVEVVGHGPRAISNGLTIPGFAERHADRLRDRVSACAVRRRRTETSAGRAEALSDLLAGMREHGHDGPGPRYQLATGGMAAPCMHAGGLVTSSQTVATWLSELTADGTQHWVTATAAPCTSLIKPVAVDDPLELGPAPSDRYDPATLWWRHERLHRTVLRDPARLLPPLTAERDEVERGWLASPPDPREAFATADALTERWVTRLRTSEVDDRRPPAVRRYWRLRDHRAELPDPRVAAMTVG